MRKYLWAILNIFGYNFTGMSELAMQVIAENKRTQNPYLDLGNCGLTELPAKLFECVWLEELIVSNAYWDPKNRCWINSNNCGNGNEVSAIPYEIIKLKKLRRLMISGDYSNSWRISDISFIENLTGLQSLDLSSNKISDISCLSNLNGLQFLYLGSNQISNISFVSNLTGLKSLYLGSNQIIDIGPLSGLTGLQSLSLRYNQITDASFVSNLTGLQSLDLSGNQVTDIGFIENLPELQLLDLSANQTADYSFISNLTSLKSLYLGGNQLTDISFMKNLTGLQTLSLRYNQVRDISFLRNLTGLQSLDLSSNQITDYHFLSDLTGLQSLYLSFNQLTDISFLSNLTGLQLLDLGDNEITDISYISNLTGLQSLDLSSNQITEYHFLSNLIDLRSLYLKSNRITDISFLSNLTALQSLDLNVNQITDISFLRNLTGLQSLDLRYNQITDVGDLSKLTLLTKLLLNKNKITSILSLKFFIDRPTNPMNIEIGESWTNKAGINVKGNPLITPPVEIIKQGNKAILNYFNELEKQGTEYLYEAKMLIVGQPRAGKTSLRFKLFDIDAALPGEEKTTRGIDIEQLDFDIIDKDGKLRKFKYNIWDFGGQQIYQATHQFFLTNRSLYVLVMDTGKDCIGHDDTTVNYWLQAVELLGANSPILLVRNEKNERQVNIDLPQKRARFVFLKNDYGIDLNALIAGTATFKETRYNDFNKLKEDIETELRRLPLVGFPMPKNWVHIREELQEISKKSTHISRQQYMDICDRFEVTEFRKQMELSRIFHDLGIFLHFQDYDTLEEFIILQNVWATDAVFAVLDNGDVKINKGRFTDASLSGIWSGRNYDAAVHKKLLALMMQFELCYKINKGKEIIYIVPELLDDKAPEGYQWNAENDLEVYYRYDFMPKGLLTRLIVRLHSYIEVNNNRQSVWKTGLKVNGKGFDCANTFAEITEAWDNKQLSIRIQGVFPKDLMSKITFQVDLLNNEFFKPVGDSEPAQRSRWYKMVPCNCSTCERGIEKHYYEYNELQERKEYGKNTIECKKRPYSTVNIDELLGDVFIKDPGPAAIKNKAKKIFISYAHKDEKWKDKLKSNLASLRNQDFLVDWDDRQIEAGDWDSQIEEAMEHTDIFLLLITHNFLSSAYISSKEIEKAYSKFKAGESKIFPVICDACDWRLQPITRTEKEMHPVEKKDMYTWLGKFQPFPKDGKPIKNWTNQQNGFMDVIDQLKKYL